MPISPGSDSVITTRADMRSFPVHQRRGVCVHTVRSSPESFLFATPDEVLTSAFSGWSLHSGQALYRRRDRTLYGARSRLAQAGAGQVPPLWAAASTIGVQT